MSDAPFRVSILLVVRDQAELLLRCLGSLARLGDDASFEVVVVDDGSRDETSAVLAALDGDLQVLQEPEGIGWGPAVDRAAAAARGRHLVLMREDAVAADGWLDRVLAPLDDDPRAGVVHPVTITDEGAVLRRDEWACIALRRAALESVGGVAGASRPGRAEKISLLAALDAAGWTSAQAPSAVVLALALAA